MPVPHEVVVVIDRTPVRDWTEYSIETSMLQPSDQFSMSLGPVTPELWKLCTPDTDVQVLIDGRTILRGYIDDREVSGATLSISGRDKSSRLVDESMDLIDFRDQTIRQVIEAAAKPWFDRVVTSNARNRDSLRGRRAAKARAGKEPLSEAAIRQRKQAPRKVEPGQTRWDLIVEFLSEFDMIVWSSGDGRELVVGRPNYSQEPQYRFLRAGPDSAPEVRAVANVVDRTVRDSVAELYERVTVTGSNIGDGANYGRAVTELAATEVDSSGRFKRRKQLIMTANVKSQKDARDIARNELLVRAAGGRMVDVTVRGHDQRRLPDAEPALYAPDTVCQYTDEEIGEPPARYLVVACSYNNSRQSGETTTLSLVPVGTELRLT